MRPSPTLKKFLPLLTALVLLAVCTLPVFGAAGDNVQSVLDLLNTLQRADIDPAWLPDIAANESSVQRLLDAYLRCSEEERATFTDAQANSLRAYFEALYAVQGRDVAELDALLAGNTASSSPASSSASPSSAVSSSAPSSSSPAASSAPAGSSSLSSAVSSASAASTSSGASSATSSAVLAPASQHSAAVTPVRPPQPPTEGDGWAELLGNRAVGVGLLLLLLVCLGLVVLQYISALRRAAKLVKQEQQEDLHNRELFGDSYQDELLLHDSDKSSSIPPTKKHNIAALPKPKNEPKPSSSATAKKSAPAAAPQQPAQQEDKQISEPENFLRRSFAGASAASDTSGNAQRPAFDDPAPDAAPPKTDDSRLLNSVAAALQATVKEDSVSVPPPSPAPAPLKRSPNRSRRTGRPGRMPVLPSDSEDPASIDD